LQSAKAVANRMLDQLGANCAAASQCASKPTETPVPGTANASVANASTPKSAAFESASARAQALSEACERMQEENGGVSRASFGGGRRNAAVPPSEVDRKQKSFQIVRTCISECAGAQSRLDNARPDQPIEAFNTYVVACESSYADAAAL
jgi:hypothetical protein